MKPNACDNAVFSVSDMELSKGKEAALLSWVSHLSFDPSSHNISHNQWSFWQINSVCPEEPVCKIIHMKDGRQLRRFAYKVWAGILMQIVMLFVLDSLSNVFVFVYL